VVLLQRDGLFDLVFEQIAQCCSGRRRGLVRDLIVGAHGRRWWRRLRDPAAHDAADRAAWYATFHTAAADRIAAGFGQIAARDRLVGRTSAWPEG
jgi:hypothetical protein